VAVASAGPYASVQLAPDNNHTSTPPLCFLQAGYPSCRPTNSVKALKALLQYIKQLVIIIAASYVDRAATDTGTVADMAATRKTEKYSTLSSAYRFEPIAVENLGVFSSTTLNIISELGRRICVHTGDARETSYSFQHISIMLQCFNSVLLHDTLPVDLPDL